MKMYLKLAVLLLICYISPLAISAQTTLVNYGSSWSYYDNQNEPAVQGSFDWNDAAYDASSWSSGNAQLGYGDGDESTTVNSSTYTLYVRHSFNVSSPGDFDSINLNLTYDDGAIVYLNGVEVWRVNMAGGSVSYGTFAASDSGDNASDSTVLAQTLQVGTNVLAVEIHQRTSGSSDISFDFSLSANAPGSVNVNRGPYLQKGSSNSMVVRWRTATPTESVIDYGTTLGNLNQNSSNLTLKTDHEIELTGLASNMVYYYQISNAAAVLVPEASDLYFKTHPTAGTSEPYSFWILGDAGTANQDQRNVRDAYYDYIGSNVTDGILFLGDNAYNDGTQSQYQTAVFQNMYEDKLKNSVAWSTLGNHDGYSSDSASQTGPYYEIFTFPTAGESGGLASGTEAYYAFDYGNIHFIVLESYDTDRSVGGAMYNWAQSDIQNTTQEWIIAIWHHPPYTKGSHNSDTETNLIQMRENFLPMLETNGVDLFLSGHSHSYERSYFLNGHYGTSGTFNSGSMTVGANGNGDGRTNGNGAYIKATSNPDGAVYITTGSAGKISGGSLNHNAMYASLNMLGSCILEVDGNTLNLKFIRETGEIADYFTIQKGCTTGASCDDGDPCTTNDVYDASCGCAGTPEPDSDNDGVCDAVDQEANSPCPLNVDANGVSIDSDGDGLVDCLDSEPNSPCPNNVDANGISLDSDNDGVCDDNDICPGGDDSADLDGDGIPDFCDTSTCLPDTSNFGTNSLSHSGSGSSNTFASIPVDGQDISFTVSGLSERTGGKPAKRYIEEVTITYVNEQGSTQSYGTFNAGSSSSVNVSISGFVQSVSVSLADAYDGNSSTNMSVNLSTVNFCVEVIQCNDSDGDGVCDPDDQCPGQDDALIGTPCDDGDVCTTNDVYDNNCGCSGTPVPDSDGDGVCDTEDQCPGQDDALIGTACDDGDACTTNDVYDANCGCSGTPLPDSDGDGICDAEDQCPGQDDALIGTPCDDGDACTTNDVYDANCGCSGTPSADSDGDGICDGEDQCPGQDDALIGTACDDGDACTINDVYDANCGCSGTLGPDSDGDGICDAEDQCPGFDDALIGTSCDDGDACTTNDVYDNNCGCAGTPVPDSDGDGVCDTEDQCPGQDDALIGTSCDDGDACTINDVYDANCGCSGTLGPDSDGDGICDAEDQCPGFDDALIGTSCDDGDACTTNDVYDSNCGCAGTPVPDSDGDGVCDTEDQCPGFDDALIGTSCDDGDACTTNDVYDASCGCSGTPLPDNDGDGYCSGEDPNDNDPCVPDSNSPACNPCADLTIDGFESGFGNWNDGGNDTARVTSYANTGSYSIRLRDNSGNSSSIYSDALNLSSYSEVYFEFSYYARSMENGEDFFLEISSNGGSSYSNVQTWARGTDFNNSIHYNESVLVSGPFTSNTVFRIRCDASANNDQIYIDDVVVTTCSNPAPRLISNVKEEIVTIKTISIYPNPATNILYVSCVDYEGEAIQITLYDINGRVVRNLSLTGSYDKAQEINVSDLAEGMYLLRMLDSNQEVIKTKRIVIKK